MSATGNVVEKEVEVANRLGLHARPASLIARKAMEYSCSLEALKDGESVDLRSLMSILMLSAGFGTRMVIRGNGADAAEAVGAIAELFASKFGEE